MQDFAPRASASRLTAATAELAKGQEQLRQTASRAARDMPVQSGNLRVSAGMLADTEMIRAIRILESVPYRDGPQAKRGALADGYASQAIALLQELHAEGYFAGVDRARALRTDPDLRPVRARPDFRRLLPDADREPGGRK